MADLRSFQQCPVKKLKPPNVVLPEAGYAGTTRAVLSGCFSSMAAASAYKCPRRVVSILFLKDPKVFSLPRLTIVASGRGYV